MEKNLKNIIKETNEYQLWSWNYPSILILSGLIGSLLATNGYMLLLSIISFVAGHNLIYGTRASWLSIMSIDETKRANYISNINSTSVHFRNSNDKDILKWRKTFISLLLTLPLALVLLTIGLVQLTFLVKVSLLTIALVITYLLSIYAETVDYIIYDSKINRLNLTNKEIIIKLRQLSSKLKFRDIMNLSKNMFIPFIVAILITIITTFILGALIPTSATSILFPIIIGISFIKVSSLSNGYKAELYRKLVNL